MDKISQGVGSRHELSSSLAEAVVAHFELSQVWNVALVTQLDRAALRDFVHIDAQIPQEVQVLGLDDELEAVVANSVDSQVEHFQVRELCALSDVLGSLGIDHVAAQVDFLNVPQVFRVENILNALVAQSVSR